MNDYPLISIIIPVYNRGKYIVQGLDSVLKENYPCKEIVLIDDGSTDNTDKVIKSWIEEHKNDITVVYKSRQNKGFIPTLNELIDMSNGKYIVFFGSDDYLKNNGITKRYEYLKKHPEKLMVVADCNLIDENNNQIHESTLISIGKVNKKLLLTDDSMKKFMILNGYFPGAVLMADKKIYEILGKYDENLHAEDWVYYIRVVAKDLLGYIDEVVSAYRVHSENMCFSDIQLTQAKEQFLMILNVFSQFKELKHKFFLLLKLFFLSFYIPYLFIKFKLAAKEKTYFENNQKTSLAFIKMISKVFCSLKDIFNLATYSIFKN